MQNSWQLTKALSLLKRNSSEEFDKPIGHDKYLNFPLGKRKVVRSLAFDDKGTW